MLGARAQPGAQPTPHESRGWNRPSSSPRCTRPGATCLSTSPTTLKRIRVALNYEAFVKWVPVASPDHHVRGTRWPVGRQVGGGLVYLEHGSSLCRQYRHALGHEAPKAQCKGGAI